LIVLNPRPGLTLILGGSRWFVLTSSIRCLDTTLMAVPEQVALTRTGNLVVPRRSFGTRNPRPESHLCRDNERVSCFEQERTCGSPYLCPKRFSLAVVIFHSLSHVGSACKYSRVSMGVTGRTSGMGRDTRTQTCGEGLYASSSAAPISCPDLPISEKEGWLWKSVRNVKL